jgi:xanthine dehydrogenase molybdopterin-binding subunit B
VEVDTETGEVTVCDLVGVVDCGTVVNKTLVRVQTEGGFAQGLGMALYEQVRNDKNMDDVIAIRISEADKIMDEISKVKAELEKEKAELLKKKDGPIEAEFEIIDDDDFS